MGCVRLKQPDRMPTGFQAMFWLAKYGGITKKELMYDYRKTAELTERACREYEPDTTGPAMQVSAIGPILDAVDFKQLQWPGHGVGDDQPYQYIGREYMTADEYDDFLLDPTGFFLGKYLPRVAGAYDGLQPLATLSENHYFGVGFGSIVFALPSVQQALAKLAASGAVAREHMTCSIALTQRLKGLGFPYGFGCTVSAPYDLVTDFMRGAKGIMTDLYRHRDKLAAVFEKIKKLSVGPAIAAAKNSGNPLVFIPIHWAADSFISQKHFEEVWWSSAREMLVGLIDADLIPLVLWESDCTKRLETIKDIPAGKCIYWFERTDMVKAFEVLGDMVALRGNVSAGAHMAN